MDTSNLIPVSSTATPTSTPAVSPLRQRFIDHLILQQKAPRTVLAYTAFVRDLAQFHRRSPDRLGPPEIRAWLLHLITERKLSASSVNLAINALRAFFHGLLGLDLEPWLVGIRRPPRLPQPPRVYSAAEIEQLLTVGTAGDPLARVFLMTVFGGGLRLSEATHLQVQDIDAPRLQLRVSHPKGGRQRLTLLSPVLLTELRAWYRVHRPVRWIFSQGRDQDPICKGTAQNLFYRAVRRAGLKKKLGIHSLRHSFATLLLENGVEITVVQRLLGHAQLATTARYLHVRQERLGQIRSPLGLLQLGPTIAPVSR
jgi:site-specific recombinase XerD